VIDVSKKYLPEMAKGFLSPKATVNIGDGFKYLQQHKNEFDVIITDSSDPSGKRINSALIIVLETLLIFRHSELSISTTVLFTDERSAQTPSWHSPLSR
jgi:predicted membrane-bound spermidine synthase